MAEDDSQFSYSQRSTQMQTVLFENATDIKVQLTLCVCVFIIIIIIVGRKVFHISSW